jgi:hypothetical protein
MTKKFMSSNRFVPTKTCMTEQLFIPEMKSRTNQMLQNNEKIQNKEDNIFLSSLALEVDDIFFSLRKADQIIRRELNILGNKNIKVFKNTLIPPINEDKFKKIVHELPPHQILVDEYIVYMLENQNNSIFRLIREYNEYLEQRNNEIENEHFCGLIHVDEKLVHYIRQLGAMIYHLNIHLNLLTVLLKNASVVAETQHIAIKESQEAVTDYMVNEWGEQQEKVRFLEVTIEEPYAIVTWSIEELRGEAILIRKEGYWQLMNISSRIFGFKDFEQADIPFDVAQRMLRLHHQKLGY